MLYYEIHPENPQPRLISKAVEALNNGEIIIYPTDTVYGLGCSIYQRSAIERLYRLKAKPVSQSMSIMCSSIQQAAKYAKISNFAFRLMKRCFPGPFTIILEATREIPRVMLTRKKEVGIRIPDHPVCQMLLEELAHPILNTSANVAENGYAGGSIDLAAYDANQADLVLDCGTLQDSEYSTVLRVVHDEIEVIRTGKGDIDRLFF